MITDELLHVAARILLRTCAPLTAHAVLSRVGRLFPQRRTPEEVERAASTLSSRGTCLSRTLALAATAPGAEVVIGVQPGGGRAVSAHAWIEIDGRPLHSDHPLGQEIARLGGQRRQPSRV
jgi:hypothetical protein